MHETVPAIIIITINHQIQKKLTPKHKTISSPGKLKDLHISFPTKNYTELNESWTSVAGLLQLLAPD